MSWDAPRPPVADLIRAHAEGIGGFFRAVEKGEKLSVVHTLVIMPISHRAQPQKGSGLPNRQCVTLTRAQMREDHMTRKTTAPETPEMEAMRRSIGARLEAVRAYWDLRQADVGNVLGIGQTGYHRWEGGRTWPNPYLLLMFCARFDVDFNFLYAGSMSGLRPEMAAQLVLLRPQIARPTFRRARRKGTSQA